MLEYAICGSSQPPNKGTNDYCQTSDPWNNLIYNLGGGFKDFLFSPLFGEKDPIRFISSNRMVQPPPG